MLCGSVSIWVILGHDQNATLAPSASGGGRDGSFAGARRIGAGCAVSTEHLSFHSHAGHRTCGRRVLSPANTIEMMHAAKLAWADILDADVRVTKDGVLVDADDDAIIPESGTKISIANTSYAEVHGVDLGDTWAGPALNYPLAGTHGSVPTIETSPRGVTCSRSPMPSFGVVSGQLRI